MSRVGLCSLLAEIKAAVGGPIWPQQRRDEYFDANLTFIFVIILTYYIYTIC